LPKSPKLENPNLWPAAEKDDRGEESSVWAVASRLGNDEAVYIRDNFGNSGDFGNVGNL